MSVYGKLNGPFCKIYGKMNVLFCFFLLSSCGKEWMIFSDHSMVKWMAICQIYGNMNCPFCQIYGNMKGLFFYHFML